MDKVSSRTSSLMLLVFALGTAVPLLPLPASALAGAIAKQEFFKKDDASSSVGTQVYDENERSAVTNKLAGVETKWRSMMLKGNLPWRGLSLDKCT